MANKIDRQKPTKRQIEKILKDNVTEYSRILILDAGVVIDVNGILHRTAMTALEYRIGLRYSGITATGENKLKVTFRYL